MPDRLLIIDNSSFESTDHDNGQHSEAIPDWYISGDGKGAGDWNPKGTSLDEGTITGENVAYIDEDGVSISQQLSETYDIGEVYDFTLDIGDSKDGSANYTVNIYAGSTVIGTVTGDTGDFDRLSEVTVSSSGFSSPALVGQPITIEIVKNSGDEMTIDNVRGVVRHVQDGTVDGEATGEIMDVGYDDSLGDDDGGGDLITSGADSILGGGGDDTISGGGGDDTIFGDLNGPATPEVTNLFIANHSFEDEAFGDGKFSGGVDSWDNTGDDDDVGTWNPKGTAIDESTLEGENLAYLYSDGDTLSQELSTTYDATKTYAFDLDVGGTENSNSSYTVNIYAGSTIIGTTSGNTGSAEELSTISVSSNGFSSPALNGQNITIEIIKTGGDELGVDNVRGYEIDENPHPAGDDVIDGGAGNDVIDGGDGADTITGGTGDDIITGGSSGDVFRLLDGFGNDTILDFDTSDDDSDGFFNDQFDVTGLTDENGDPLNAFDVKVEDNGSGDALLTFSNGETITLVGVAPSAIDDASELFAAGIPCFGFGTMIDTPSGAVPVETLTAGDQVTTLDSGPQEVIWAGARGLSKAELRANPDLCPIRIRAGAIGNADDLLLSPQHTVMVEIEGSERLVRAKHLPLLVKGKARVARKVRGVQYAHILLKSHGLINANGAICETLYPGSEGLKALPLGSKIAIWQLYPALAPGLNAQPVEIAYGPRVRETIGRGALRKLQRRVRQLQSCDADTLFSFRQLKRGGMDAIQTAA